MPARRLILNADDLGRSAEVNAAILRTHREGVLTSASLMVAEPGAAEAIEMARRCPSLAVGLHLALSDGRAALPPGAVPRLVGLDGRLRSSPALAGLVIFLRPCARRQAAAEIAEQFRRFAATGLPFDHVNGHQHLHLHPVVWDALVACCREHGVRAVRIPCEEFRLHSPGRAAPRRFQWAVFRALRRRCLRSLAGSDIVAADRVYGHLESGSMTEDYVLDLLARLGGETNEVYFHPGTAHAHRRPGAALDVEAECLLSPRVRARIEALGLVRTAYGQLTADTQAGSEAER